VEADFDLIEVDMHQFFAICADFGHLTVKIDGVTATRAARNDDPDNFGFLLHLETSFQKLLKIKSFGYSGWVLHH
jgi:hypothetical protein